MFENIISLIAIVLVFFGFEANTAVTSPTVEPETAIVLRIIDGDTIDVMLNGEEQRVRYIGIDTPEPYSEREPGCFSNEASEANRELVENKRVTLVSDKENTDHYDRLLRYVYVDDVFVNAELMRGGFATTLPIKPNTSQSRQFKILENEAKAEQRGLWEVCR